MTTGLSSVIETVETSLGVPDPEEMAKKVRDDEQKVQETVRSDEPGEQDEKKGEGSVVSAMSVLTLFCFRLGVRIWTRKTCTKLFA